MDETNRLLGLQDEENESSDGRDTQKGKYMTFKSGNEYFGLGIQYADHSVSGGHQDS